MTDPAAPCGAHPITEDCCCLCHEAGRADERRRIREGSHLNSGVGIAGIAGTYWYLVPSDMLRDDCGQC